MMTINKGRVVDRLILIPSLDANFVSRRRVFKKPNTGHVELHKQQTFYGVII